MKVTAAGTWVAGAVLLFLAGLSFMIRAVARYVTFSIGGTVWDVLAAVGTIGATLIAVILALRAWQGERVRAARLVSAWVTEEFKANVAASRYERAVTLHVANEGNEPAFDNRVNVVVGTGTRIGPLAAPPIIPVLPPRRELTFDISAPIRFREELANPRVEMSFTDAKGRKWIRDEAGELRRVAVGTRGLLAEEPADVAQLGPLDPSNPITPAADFYNGVVAGQDVSHLLAPETLSGWRTTDWHALRVDFLPRGISSFIAYPAPRVAWIKLVGGDAVGKSVLGDVGVELPDAKILTLSLASDRGWRVYAWGRPVTPDRVVFPDEGLQR